MKTAGRNVLSIAVACLSASVLFAAGGTSRPQQDARVPEPEQTPEERAIEHYNAGLSYRDKAWKLEKELAKAASDDERQKLQAKIAKQYDRAREELETAVKNNPKFHEAWSDLGYALRKVGRFEDALDSYDAALQISPGYTRAIEYRAEAYLGLNQIDPAKTAYMDLFARDRTQADELMRAMQKWIEARKADPAGVDTSALEAFSHWIAERAEIAGQTPPVSRLGDRPW